LRHTPGFVKGFSGTWSVPATNLAGSVSRLLHAMQEAEGEDQVSPAALDDFRLNAHLELPASDRGKKLIQADSANQRQQDSHEFLSQLLDCLGSKPLAGEPPPSPRSSGPPDEETLKRLETVERELTQVMRRRDSSADPTMSVRVKQEVGNLLYEYSMIQWSLSATRMHSHHLSDIFEGQRLASTKCQRCGRFCASGAEPFCLEEVKLNSSRWDGSWLGQIQGQLGSWLTGGASSVTSLPLKDLLQEDSPAPEGYRCPNAKCLQVGCSTRTVQYLRLPQTLVLHINRAQADGSRCEVALEFEDKLDLGKLGLVRHFGQPLDRNLSPCPTRYHLRAAVFHRGPTARSGHYFAYVLFKTSWVKVDDEKVERLRPGAENTPMALEANETSNGAKVVLLFYQRDDPVKNTKS